MKTIKVTKLSEPTCKEIIIECPECYNALSRSYPINQKEGIITCSICKTNFQWEETEED